MARGKGENLYYVSGGRAYVAGQAIKAWYDDEIILYNYDNPGFSSATGHFTQVVWRTTTKVGCGFATGPSNFGSKTVVVCQYVAPGNYQGQYVQNVPRPL